ncbi:hypothetical protein AB0K52_00450 [Glycomyces sp. NPDC049804]|uniref:hypothetical protein n=1 Tax=Glycomyces sp. NPDC049804 TaxID=3154363 RepID=UPI0034263C50
MNLAAPKPIRTPPALIAGTIALWGVLAYGCFSGMNASIARISVISAEPEASWIVLPPHYGKITLLGIGLTLAATVLRLVFAIQLSIGNRRVAYAAIATELVCGAYWIVTINLHVDMPVGIADYTGIEQAEALTVPAIGLSALVIVLLAIQGLSGRTPQAGKVYTAVTGSR